MGNVISQESILSDPKFNFKGFIPRQELRNKASSIVSYLCEKMPSDANLIAEVKKDLDHFYFKIEVNGTDAQFYADSTIDLKSEDSKDRKLLIRGMDNVFRSMRLQLKNWINKRSI